MQKLIERIDRRFIYILLIVLILWPLVKPIGMPIRVSSWTVAFYNEVEKLKDGDKVILAFDYSSGGGPDVHPQVEAIFQHLMKKNLRVICVAFIDQSTMYAESVLKDWESKGKKYGEDFVNLGYLPGVETAIAAFAGDIPKAAPQDFRKNPVSSLPIMKDVKSVNDTKLVLEFATGIPGPAEWVRQVGTKYKVPMVSGVVTVMGPQNEPYVQSGQLKGLLSGLRGAAEYEQQLKSPGKASAAMDAQSIGHVVVIVFIILGNVSYFLGRKNKKVGGGR
ncbi:MAG: hypothetical protein ACM3ZQ_11070 [Bacillota bacterium]